MNEKEVTKYFDFTVNKLSDPSGLFSINNTLFDEFNPKSANEREEFLDLCDEIKSFGVNHGYFKIIGKPANNSGYFKLTEKGIELKKFGKGHEKFQKGLKKEPLTRYQKIYLTFFILFGIIGAIRLFIPSHINKGNENNQTIENQIKATRSLKFSLKNTSEFDLKDITIGLPDTALTYNFLAKNTQTEWTHVKSAFHYGFVRFFDTKNRKYFIQPIDYMGEKAFEKGELTYVIKNIDSINQAFELDFDYMDESNIK
ncbi:hypothetical protein [Flagellimonas marinaquae]|uniref:hypothetical protein n=1 Tax=Flagellimonas marinaquae TaxID=254955 RepID=UPI000F8ECE1B|nr:hypothetical protein [Allomuricauda aquimarina]